MKYSYVFDPIAFTEYQDAILWYEDRSQIFADTFINTVNSRIGEVCRK